MCEPDESLLSPQFASRRIEESLWNLKHRGEGEIFTAYAERTEKKTSSQNICLT